MMISLFLIEILKQVEKYLTRDFALLHPQSRIDNFFRKKLKRLSYTLAVAVRIPVESNFKNVHCIFYTMYNFISNMQIFIYSKQKKQNETSAFANVLNNSENENEWKGENFSFPRNFILIASLAQLLETVACNPWHITNAKYLHVQIYIIFCCESISKMKNEWNLWMVAFDFELNKHCILEFQSFTIPNNFSYHKSAVNVVTDFQFVCIFIFFCRKTNLNPI